MGSDEAFRGRLEKLKKEKNKFVGILMPTEMYDEVKKISEDKGFMSVSVFIRTELKKSIKNAKNDLL